LYKLPIVAFHSPACCPGNLPVFQSPPHFLFKGTHVVAMSQPPRLSPGRCLAQSSDPAAESEVNSQYCKKRDMNR
jgi:hypothetical protein